MKKLFIFILMVKMFCLGLFAQGQSTEEYSTPIKRIYRVALGGGYAYRLGKIDKTGSKWIDDFTKKLRHGYHLEASGQLFFARNMGIGINAVYIKQNEAEPEIKIPSVVGYTTFKLNETTQYFYIGPSFVLHSNLKKIICYAETGAGLLIFHDSGEYMEYKANLTRPTVGFHLGFSPEYQLSSQVGIGLKLSITAGFIRTSFYGMDRKVHNVSNASVGAFISFRTK